MGERRKQKRAEEIARWYREGGKGREGEGRVGNASMTMRKL